MIKKALSAIIAMLMMITALVGCGSDTKETTTGTGATQSGEKKVLRVGMECAYAPFNWTQTTTALSNGATALPIKGTSDYAYGYDVMLAKQVADELGMDLEIVKVEWSSIILGMQAGDYDAIIAGMGYTEERDKTVDFTAPYYIRNNVLVVKKDSAYASATKLSEFAGASATTQIGTTWEKYVPQIPDVEQRTYYETTAEVVMAVAMGSVDVGVLDEPTAKSAAIANPEITYVKLDSTDGFTVPEGQSLDVCIAVNEGNKELKDALDGALTAIGWNETKMNEYMDLAITLQPLSE